MTEYEIADLAISEAMRLQGLFQIFQGIVDAMGDITQQFMTVLFAFIASAYFVGASLTRRQAIIFTTLYTLWQLWTIMVHTVRGFSMRETLAAVPRDETVSETMLHLQAFMPKMVGLVSFTLLMAALAASLYFMWDVRHSNAE